MPSKSQINKQNRKRRLLKLQGGMCYYCRKSLTMKTATIEHLTPRARGGKNSFDNLAAACLECNHRQGVILNAELNIERALRDKRIREWRLHMNDRMRYWHEVIDGLVGK